MYITRRLTLDLGAEPLPRTIPVSQGDRYTRSLEILFTNQSIPWHIPDGVSVLIRYRKPDGTEGIYDTLPDNTPAWSVSENKLTVILAPQVCSIPGMVTMVITLIQGERQLSSYPFCLQVSNALPIGEDSKNYVNLSAWMHQWMQDNGLSSTQIAAEIEAYLLKHPIKTEETDPTVPAWAKAASKPTYTAVEVGALPDTTVIPTVPTKVSAFTNDAGYLTKHQDISGKLDKNQGSANVGKILMVGTDGNLFLTDLPDAPTGDVVGVLDESNNILLTGSGLADGTYTLKFENHNGTVTEVGDLVVTTIVPPSYTNLAEPNETNTTDWSIWCNSARIGSSDGKYRSGDYSVINYIPVAIGDIVRWEGFTIGTSNSLCFYKSDKVSICNCGVSTPTIFNGGVITGLATTATGGQFTIANHANLSGLAYLRFAGTPTGNINDVIITVNEPIE